MDAGRTRREFLRTAAGGGFLLALAALPGCEMDRGARARATASATAWEFRSRPDLKPPPIEVTKAASGTSPGYVFVAAKNGPGEVHGAQDGAMILDERGRLVWFLPVAAEERDAMDFKAQRYRGEPVLTWWEGEHSGYGRGEYVIADGSYEEIGRLRTGNGYEGDHHEFLLSPRGTAYVTIYHETPMDLSAAGGRAEDVVVDGIAQEIDVETGEVLFEWHSLEHVGVDESYYELTPDLEEPYDYFHINSIEEYGEDHLLISARRTSAVYKVARATGEVVWRLGGKGSDFTMGEGTRFAFQHDARLRPDGTITLFDNRGEDMNEPSRGIRLELDEEAMTASLLQEYAVPQDPFATYQGNVQNLPNGNVFVGWGSAPFVSEHDPEGDLLFEARFPEEVESYRAFRSPWLGRPRRRPDLALEADSGDDVTAYASWNGATEVATWEVLAGRDPDSLEPVAEAPSKGFETVIRTRTGQPYVAVRAKDGAGEEIGVSEAIQPPN